jgi:hypothetical protein
MGGQQDREVEHAEEGRESSMLPPTDSATLSQGTGLDAQACGDLLLFHCSVDRRGREEETARG